MDALLSLVEDTKPIKYYEAESEEDALRTFAKRHFDQSPPARDAWTRWLREHGVGDDVKCRELLEGARRAADHAVSGVAERAKREKLRPLDDDMMKSLREYSLRMALGRELERIAAMPLSPSSSASSSTARLVEDDTTIASPLSVGARFDALSSDVLHKLLKTPRSSSSSPSLVARDGFLEPIAYSYWSPLLTRDVKRATLFTSNPSSSGRGAGGNNLLLRFRDDSYFPALHAVSRLAAALASEINFKASTTFSYPHPDIEIWGVVDSSSAPPQSEHTNNDDDGLHIVYMFSSSTSPNKSSAKPRLSFHNRVTTSDDDFYSIDFKDDRIVLWCGRGKGNDGVPRFTHERKNNDDDAEYCIMYLHCRKLS